ncbi:virulence factor Mce family protein [Nonomuraea sp. WAC 01424]|uniref:MCE family protein n=1 Tax=Nonomuraea sp. WAC 01424 TaxID=2203200 RepID=UPI000F780EBC|nr:MCE family protein [Nonomuraea sp. WAC 01424]RSM94888.1 virulence factor Mce family protein [Nonomuraea sp. WAC 01424]
MNRRLAALLAVLVLAGAYLLFRPVATTRLHASFDAAVGLYPGSDVRVLGVRVGRVTSVRPEGGEVLVELAVDAGRKIPADAQAVVVARSLIADRFLQLTPPYRGGPALPDGGTLRRTRSAVEIDEALRGYDQLATALAPPRRSASDGADAPAAERGALARLLRVSASTFGGQGETVGATVRGLSDAASALAGDGDDLARTVRDLATVTGAMARDDARVRAFMKDLAGVSAQLNGEREELRAVLKELSSTLTQVADFVEDNRGEITANTRDLAHITDLLVRQRESIGTFLDAAPLALNNANNAYDPASATFRARFNLNGQTDDVAMWLCSLAHSMNTGCDPLLNALNPLGRALNDTVALDTSWLLPDVRVERPDLSLGGLVTLR